MASIRSSLTFRCLACIIVYAAAIILLFWLSNTMIEKRLSEAFPSITTIEEQSNALATDNFASLKSSLPDSSQIIVFDEDGSRLYASSSSIAEQITADDLDIINPGGDEQTFYEVLEKQDPEKGQLYEIMLCSYDGENGITNVQSYCVCDSNLHIIKGSLFSGRTSLTEREFALISGVFESRMTIEKYDYSNADDEGRTIVLASPIISDATYDATVAQAGEVWLFAIPIAILFTIIVVLLMYRMIRNAVRPLDVAINERKASRRADDQQVKHLSWELRPTYENFEELMDQLDETQESQQQMIADISHDLKIPLTVIRGYTQAFEDGKVPADKQDEYLHIIGEKSKFATELIDSLFAYAKTNHPSYDLQLERCDLCELMRLQVIDVQAEVDQAGCSMQVDIDDDPLFAMVDVNLLKRAVGNLISNACKHNPAGTTIAVGCHRVGSVGMISVADDGVGVSKEMRQNAFKPFVTSNVARKSGEGSGLGLAIASRCAELHGGKIYFADNPRHPFKTEITIELPTCPS